MSDQKNDMSISDVLKNIAGSLDETYVDGVGVNRNAGNDLPRSKEVIALTEKLLAVVFPGFENPADKRDTADILAELFEILCELVRRSVRHQADGDCPHSGVCRQHSVCSNASLALIKSLPELREVVKLDVAAAYSGDPAARNFDEIIVSYPGLKAITVQRLAHVLYLEKVPLIPRMMTEYAHSVTGIDIHPGAAIGKGVFIDHGTGVVVGETAVIGDNVRIYQGVTLGAVNFPKDACGILIKGNKRHPTIGSNVTIYSGASVLGDIVIGDNSVIGGNVWLTESLPAGTKITARTPENMVKFASEHSCK